MKKEREREKQDLESVRQTVQAFYDQRAECVRADRARMISQKAKEDKKKEEELQAIRELNRIEYEARNEQVEGERLEKLHKAKLQSRISRQQRKAEQRRLADEKHQFLQAKRELVSRWRSEGEQSATRRKQDDADEAEWRRQCATTWRREHQIAMSTCFGTLCREHNHIRSNVRAVTAAGKERRHQREEERLKEARQRVIQIDAISSPSSRRSSPSPHTRLVRIVESPEMCIILFFFSSLSVCAQLS